MVIARIMGGLGNQLFQYAIGRSISLTHNDILKLDASYFDEFKAHGGFRLKNFAIDAPIASITEIKRLAPRSRILHRLARKGIFHYKKKSFYIERREEESRFIPRVFDYKDVYLSGYFCNENYFADIRSELLSDLVLQTPLSAAARDFMRVVKQENSVSVHIRLSDLKSDSHKLSKKVSDAGKRAPTIGVEYYKKAVRSALEKIESPTFFIFSNDQAWSKANLDFIPSNNAVFVDQTQNELEDFELMRNCKHNIVANSTFSYWAAWLNNNENKRVIAPQTWYENWREFDPCPANWDRV
ncbi:MAG: alpha-1,2-fucosyltransferase [Helicobacteraceae bacterium]|nr:alpha-1,2-fucosyltransferase [Helicobacteraceae bacterium]